MKLVTNERYLALIREAFDGSILPELQTPAAKATAGLIRSILGMNHGLLNLQAGINPDIRYSVIELAFGPQLMELGMASSASTS